MDHDGSTPMTRSIAARLAPFVAWLASQEPDERTRRDYRETVEGYLVFEAGDDGVPESRPSRYLAECRELNPDTLRWALAKLAEHDAVVRLSLPTDR